MTPKERIDQLIENGGILQLLPSPGAAVIQEFTLAGALWLARPARLRWCPIFPEHQGHIHETRYNTAELANGGRDVLFYRGKQLAFSVVPYLEAALNTDEVRAALAEWRARLKLFDNDKNFAEFLATA